MVAGSRRYVIILRPFNPGPLTIQFQYTPQLLQRAHELHYKKFFPLRGKVILILGILSAWSGLLLLLVKGGGKNLWYSVPLIIYGVVAVILHFYTNRTIGKRAFKKLKDYHDPFTMRIDESGVEISIGEQPYALQWDKIQKALLTDEMILLYPNDKVFFIFPEENFTPQDFSDFRIMAKERVSKTF